MNTIEAIRFINDHIRQAYYMGTVERRKADDINRLLRQGQKFEKMWGEIKTIISSHTLIWLEKRMIVLEEKHFPKRKVIK